MKRLFWGIFALLTIVACSDDSLLHTPNSTLINFGNITTRAAVSKDNITEFGVMADMNLGADNTPEALRWVPMFENERIYKSTNGFTYDNTRYWIDGRTFFFFAVYPYGASVTRTEETIEWEDAEGKMQTGTKFQYSVDVSVPIDASTDYLVAQRTVSTMNVTNYPTVDLSFNHLLSQINVVVKKSNEYNAKDIFIVTQVALSGISRTATFEAVHAPNSYRDTLSTITESRLVRRQNLNQELTADGVNVLGENNGLLVVPQQIRSAKFSFNYSYQEYNSTTSTYGDIQYSTIEVNIPTDTVAEWLKGKNYTYTLTLKKDHNIYIGTPTVNDWSSPQAGGTVIIQ